MDKNVQQKILKRTLKWTILLICVIIFLKILEDVFEKDKLIIDTIVYNFVVLKLRMEPLTTIMKIITNLGGAYFLIGITILSIIFLKDKKISLLISLNVVISTTLNIINRKSG